MRRARYLGIVLVCFLVGATVAAGIPKHQAARSQRCPPASLGQQSVPNAIETVLQQRCLRDIYGGDELEHGRVHIFVANHGQRRISAALASIARRAAYFFSPVPHTWATLKHDVREVSPVAVNGGPHWKATDCYPDPAQSTVTVEVHGDMAAARAALAQRFPNTPIRIVTDNTGAGARTS